MGGVSKNLVLATLKRESTKGVPIWLMRQAGRYLPEYRTLRSNARDFLALCYTPRLAAEITLQPIKRFGFDAAIIFSDILLIPHALGQKLRFEEGRGPVLDALSGEKDIAALKSVKLTERLAAVYETLALVRGALPSETALIGFAGAPWTVATYMLEGGGSVDHAKARLFALQAPDGLAKLIDILTEATIEHLTAQVHAGAEVIQLFETWGGVLSADNFAKLCIEPTRRIVDALRKAFPTLPVIGFPRMAGHSMLRYAAETGISAISLDWTVPLDQARDRLQPLAVLQGNLDPLALVAGGQSMRDQTSRILEAWSAGGMIFNLGHGILPQTPIEHVEALIAQVRDFRR